MGFPIFNRWIVCKHRGILNLPRWRLEATPCSAAWSSTSQKIHSCGTWLTSSCLARPCLWRPSCPMHPAPPGKFISPRAAWRWPNRSARLPQKGRRVDLMMKFCAEAWCWFHINSAMTADVRKLWNLSRSFKNGVGYTCWIYHIYDHLRSFTDMCITCIHIVAVTYCSCLIPIYMTKCFLMAKYMPFKY